jgi:hypothetical protein
MKGALMSITFNTTDPRGLLAAFKKAIDDRHVVTWTYDRDGDFTHATEQWKNKAWMRPKVANGELRFGIVKRNNQDMSREVYAIYHGRFIESMLAHFDKRFAYSFATAIPNSDDLV